MGKKSKRRGGGGGSKKRTAGAGAVGGSSVSALDLPASASGAAGSLNTPADDALALLETVTPLTSLKGVVSTNDDPGRCSLCSGPVVLCGRISYDKVLLNMPCCGKRFCVACVSQCARAGYSCGFAADLVGEFRCIFCMASTDTTRDKALKNLLSGMPWVHYTLGLSYLLKESPNEAIHYMVKAARQGHPEAFFTLSELCRGKWRLPRDLLAAQAYAEKARSLHPDLRLPSNTALVDIAEDYRDDGAVEEANAILVDIAKEADPNALDSALCERIAAALYEIEQYQLSGEMWARSFCHGLVGSALCASDCYLLSEHYALGKLWLSVACKTKSDYSCFVPMPDGTIEARSWSDGRAHRDEIRSKLRDIRDSCGGCGAALQGDMRQYCRGCRAYCYCSKECQKLHWNRADGGHRNECKESQEHSRKILEAIHNGKIDLSKKTKIDE